MPRRTTHIAQKLKAAATLLLLLLCVCSAVAREKNRAIALPFEDSVYNFRMLYEYDSWNRVQRIVYPDSEVVTYNYDLGGQLYSVSTFKNNVSSSLINSILYDEFGHRTQVNFGNGVTTNYTYDILQRLSLLETQKPGNPALQKISYSFDNEDNITRVANSTAPMNGLGGSYTFDYQYDNLYRLTSSTGSFTPTNASYFLEMHYTPAGRICRKEQGDNNATKRLLYSYNPNNAPHAARRIYDPSTTNLRQMLWDANGNIAQISEYQYDATNEIVNLQDFRNHYWDEDDRLNLVLDNSHFSYCLYSNDGQRVAKLTGSAFSLGTGFATNALLDNYTLYPSEYLVVTQQGYTKYYYANGTRIASRLGSGGFEKMQRLCTEELNLTANANALFNSVVAKIGDDMPEYHISDPCPDYYPDIAGFRVQLPTLNIEPNFGITAQQNILQTFRQNYANEETYYFHGNHLGSANWVTLQNASPTHFLLHLPYGEEFVKQLSGSYDERFTFTGKEKDIETGYYYFGARFDNVDLGFMSVDPMADKYPSMSPYAYCAWNPIKLVDPEGEDWYRNDEGSAVLWKNCNKQTINIKGESYKNIGKTYSSKIKNGGYINYYQNHAISISELPRNSREDLIFNDKTFYTHFKSLSINEQKDIFNARVASRGVKVDYVGIQVSGSLMLGGGYFGDISFGYMKKEGLFITGSIGAGLGFGISAGLGLTFGTYRGEGEPTKETLKGWNYNQSVVLQPFYCQRTTSVNKHNQWNTIGFGYSLGGKRQNDFNNKRNVGGGLSHTFLIH